ncbi:MAG TPA: CHAD domain-containing protein [Holophagaceae bacterium]|nr:CHAD domain-containing protein [Holophagaceae bacterium]
MAVPHHAPWKAWPAEWAGVRDGEVEAIHRLRVATRRMRAAHQLRGADPPRRLARLGKALGRVRSWDLHRELLLELPTLPDSWAEAARAELLDWIGRHRERDLEALRGLLDDPPLRPCEPPPRPDPEDLEGLLETLDREGEDPEALHALRLALKGHRYALEWLDPDSPLVDPLQDLSGALGLHRDWVELENLLEERRRRWRKRGRLELAGGLEELRREAARRRGAAFAALAPLADALRAGLPAVRT